MILTGKSAKCTVALSADYHTTELSYLQACFPGFHVNSLLPRDRERNKLADF